MKVTGGLPIFLGGLNPCPVTAWDDSFLDHEEQGLMHFVGRALQPALLHKHLEI